MSFEYKRWKEQQSSATNDTPVPEAGCPTAIFLVGMIWAAVGLVLLLTFLMLALKLGKPSQYVGLIPFGVIHLSSGLRTIYGTAAGTIRNGLVSVALGLTWVMLASLSAHGMSTKAALDLNAQLMVIGIAAVGVVLLLAGCVAVIASGSYRRWRDPHETGAGARDPIQTQRAYVPTGREKDPGPRPSVPGWVWVLAGFGALGIAFLGGAALFVKPRAPSGNSTPTATIEDYGRYGSKGRVQAEADRDAPGGVNILSDAGGFLVEQTDQIPCQIGEQWGLRIRISDAPANRAYMVRQEIHHPPMQHPDGSVRTKTVREVKVRSGGSPERYYGWIFLKGYEYELVPGEWSIVVFVDEVEVSRRSFQVRK